MDFALSTEEEAFRREVCEFLDRELTPDVPKELEQGLGLGPRSWEFLRKMGARGWLTPQWPEEYGGLSAPYFYRYIIGEEVSYRGGPHGMVAAHMAGPTILMFGSDEQKREWLPRIARGEVEFALGYTEPEAGSDLANLQIRAVEDGDDYVMNGQKLFNTACHYAQYHWLGARTDTEGPKHKGVSLFIVPLDSPGITIRPLWEMGGARTNEVFYDNVRVPKKNLVGQKNRGFYHIMTALDFERIYQVGEIRRMFERLLRYVKETRHNGGRLAEDPLVRQRVAQLAVELEVAQVLALRVAWMLNRGEVPNYEAAMIKMYGSELNQRLAIRAMEIMGLYSQLIEGSKWAELEGWWEQRYRASIRPLIVRGTSNVQRNIVAMRGLGLPRG